RRPRHRRHRPCRRGRSGVLFGRRQFLARRRLRRARPRRHADRGVAQRDARKPVIAKVQGYAIGGGNVLATVCDLTIASEKAVFGQVGPRVGSVDPGWGTAYLARLVGEKRAREIWFLCRRYTAAEAFQMGLVNKVVPADQLDAEVAAWCREILALSPTAIAIAKRSFNADSENIRGIGALGFEALALYYGTEEAKEGTRAFMEKRKPNFRK